MSKKKIVTGKVTIAEAGFGFLMSQDADDIYLSKLQTSKVFDGELVKVEVHEKQGKTEGVILDVLERKSEFVGKVLKGRSYDFVQISNDKKIIIKDYKGTGADIIRFKITKYPKQKELAEGSVIEILGRENSPKIENKIAIFKHEIPHIFNSEIQKEIKQINEDITTENRFDLRDMNFVTIDGEDSRDFDDAVLCESTDYGWTLYVAIADVAHYVKEGSELNNEALKRGNSVYFPNEVVPMLPEYLSNGLCSLNPNKDRYALVAKMNISKKGSIKSFKFMNAVINSKARLTYNQVSAMLDEENESVINEFSHVYKDLKRFETF
jgi:ribonuclease R